MIACGLRTYSLAHLLTCSLAHVKGSRMLQLRPHLLPTLADAIATGLLVGASAFTIQALWSDALGTLACQIGSRYYR